MITIRLLAAYDRVTAFLQRAALEVLPLAARLVFASVLLLYFWSSFATKIEPGLFGFLQVKPSAYYQIAMSAVEAAGGDVSAVPFWPIGLMVRIGTYAEFLLPLLIVLGLFTRIAAAGMINFVAVQTFVDITVHKVDAATIGSLFDRFPDAAISDQRLLWVLVLLVLVMLGAGSLSLDRLIRWRTERRLRPKKPEIVWAQ